MSKVTISKLQYAINRIKREAPKSREYNVRLWHVVIKGHSYWSMYFPSKLRQNSNESLPRYKMIGAKDSESFCLWMEQYGVHVKLTALRTALDILVTEGESAAKQYLDALPFDTDFLDQQSEASVEWYTPPEFVDMARTVLGGIDLDPASNPIAQGWVKAERFYTKDDDGLAQPWAGRVWCNPPYGKFTKLFMERALAFYETGEVTDCIFLVNRTGASWYVDLLERFSGVCQVRKRISFWTPEGKPEGSPRYYNDFLYLGKSTKKFQQVFSSVGKV